MSTSLDFWYGVQLSRPPGATGRFSEMPIESASSQGAICAHRPWPTRHPGRARPCRSGDRDLANVEVPLRPASNVRGRVVLDVNPALPAHMDSGGHLSLSLEPASPASTLATARTSVSGGEANSFAMTGVAPGPYVLQPLSGWTIETAVADGHDYAAAPLDLSDGRSVSDLVVTVTNRVGTLAGSVHDDHDAPTGHAAVILFPERADLWVNYGRAPQRIKTLASRPPAPIGSRASRPAPITWSPFLRSA